MKRQPTLLLFIVIFSFVTSCITKHTPPGDINLQSGKSKTFKAISNDTQATLVWYLDDEKVMQSTSEYTYTAETVDDTMVTHTLVVREEKDGTTNFFNRAGTRSVTWTIYVTDSVKFQHEHAYIDVDQWRDEPIRHRYLHGGFKGTDCRFSFYFPPQATYSGRFFQPLQAISGNENYAPEAMSQSSFSVQFAIGTGAYLVESNLGRRDMFVGDDPTIAGYRASAAVAEYSRVMAAEMYGPHRPYGYVFGGSGGSLKTISCLENTDVWDGAVPFVIGSAVSMPNAFTVQAHAMRIVREKFPMIVDAIEPGGSGDMYAGLNAEERAALSEVTRMGFPPRSWFHLDRIAFGYTGVFSSLIDDIIKWDPSYFEDFWTVPGYLGADAPESLLKDKIEHTTKITMLLMPSALEMLGLPASMSGGQKGTGFEVPAAIRLASLPEGNVQGASLFIESGAAAGHVCYIIGAMNGMVMIGYGEAHFEALSGLKAGDKVRIDNSAYLAAQTYHRHQVPSVEEFPVWKQFLTDPSDPTSPPLYPQRPEILGPRFAYQGSGGYQTGKFDGKMIMVQALMDEAAFAWKADWYRSKVKTVMQDRLDDNYRLWYVDNCMHTSPTVMPGDPRPVVTTRIISYQGVLQQALLDLAAWVEDGVAPPLSTRYKVTDGQVIVPPTAFGRRGVQPVVELMIDGSDRIDAQAGQSVTFSGAIQVPPGAGMVVKAEWDFEGTGDYPVVEEFKSADTLQCRKSVTATHAFKEAGIYFPALRVTSQRRDFIGTEFGGAQNIARVRVVVE